MHSARHETGDVSHIHEKVSPDGICNLAHEGEIDRARVSEAPAVIIFGFTS